MYYTYNALNHRVQIKSLCTTANGMSNSSSSAIQATPIGIIDPFV